MSHGARLWCKDGEDGWRRHHSSTGSSTTPATISKEQVSKLQYYHLLSIYSKASKRSSIIISPKHNEPSVRMKGHYFIIRKNEDGQRGNQECWQFGSLCVCCGCTWCRVSIVLQCRNYCSIRQGKKNYMVLVRARTALASRPTQVWSKESKRLS